MTSLERANMLAHKLRLGMDDLDTRPRQILDVLSDLIHDHANAQQRCLALEHSAEVLAAENAEAKADVLRQAARIAALESELTTLKASVVAALSSAGPEVGEDERTA